jgi:hypothetical protein
LAVIGISIVYNAISVALMASVPPEARSLAGGLINTAFQVSLETTCRPVRSACAIMLSLRTPSSRSALVAVSLSPPLSSPLLRIS